MRFGILALVAAVIQHTRILQRLEAPDYAYNAMRRRIAVDRDIRPRRGPSMTALVGLQRVLAGS
jgi:hypothetical protein